MEVSMISETEKIEFQTLALHHADIWNVADTDFCKIRLSCDRTQASKFRAVEAYPIVVVRMFVDK